MTTPILADTSAWVDYLRSPQAALLPLVEANTAATCEPVAMELLSGTRNEDEWISIRRLLGRAPLVPFDSLADFEGAARIRRVASSAGISLGSVDCMILAAAARTGSAFLTLDTKQAAVGSQIGVLVVDQ